ncbi:MAG: hypothetical protein WAV50_02985 [Minisyncoccia bacterium]
MLPFAHTVEGFAEFLKNNFGVRLHSWVLFILGLAFFIIAFMFMPSVVSFALSLTLFMAPVWLPILLVGGALSIRLILKQSEFISTRKNILLEIKPPRNLVKTPLAMEAFLSSMHFSPGESNWYARWLGRMRPWWSLEIASFEGQVHFFIWSRDDNYRRIIESQLYAQYPGVQIVEAPDYTRFISGKPEEWDIWGCDYKQSKPDPLPIKTYVEYGLDKVQKEPEQIDPLANVIEYMASIGKGEYLWLQFVFRVHKGEKYLKEHGKGYTWKDEAKEMVETIRKETRSSYVDPITGKEMPGFPNPTKGQMEMMSAIERNVSKLAFDVGGRCIYFAKKEAFDPIMITHMIALFKPFNTEGWNDINSAGWLKRFDDYPWEFRPEKLKNHYRRELVQAFRRRQFFFEPFGFGISRDEIMVMSTEELATIYHIPSASIETPSLGRIQSATGEAPANLPT